MRTLVPALLTSAALFGSHACVPVHGCTTRGCTAAAQITADVAVPWPRLQSSMISACRNATCLAGRFSVITEQPPENVGLGFSLADGPPDALVPSATVAVFTRPGGKFDIMVTWLNGAETRDGDTYRVTVFDAAGATLLSLNEKAAYEVTQPNGPDCAPVCRSANIDRRTR